MGTTKISHWPLWLVVQKKFQKNAACTVRSWWNTIATSGTHRASYAILHRNDFRQSNGAFDATWWVRQKFLIGFFGWWCSNSFKRIPYAHCDPLWNTIATPGTHKPVTRFFIGTKFASQMVLLMQLDGYDKNFSLASLAGGAAIVSKEYRMHTAILMEHYSHPWQSHTQLRDSS